VFAARQQPSLEQARNTSMAPPLAMRTSEG
jgi:hypothetical protein